MRLRPRRLGAEVPDAVERITNLPIVRQMEPRRASDPGVLVAAKDAIVAALGWQPRHADLDTILGHALAWERALGEHHDEAQPRT